jgi:hypothetical protein
MHGSDKKDVQFLVGKLERKRQLGRPKRRQEVSNRMDLRDIG